MPKLTTAVQLAIIIGLAMGLIGALSHAATQAVKSEHQHVIQLEKR